MTDSPGRQVDIYWRTIAVQAAPPGWRLLGIFAGRRDVRPIAAWLLQERHRYTAKNDNLHLAPPQTDLEAKVGPETRVIPGICVEGWGWQIDAIDCEGTAENWQVLGPDEADPTAEEWDAEIARRRARAENAPTGH